jgi:hypothetical protein
LRLWKPWSRREAGEQQQPHLRGRIARALEDQRAAWYRATEPTAPPIATSRIAFIG